MVSGVFLFFVFLVSFFGSGFLTGMNQKHYLVILILIFLMISDIEHLFICLFIYLSFLGEISIQDLCQFIIIFLNCFWVIGVLHVFRILTLIKYMICKCILPFYRLPLYSVDCFLCCTEIFKLVKPICLFLLLLPVLLVSFPRNCCQIQCPEAFMLCRIRSYVYVFNPFWVSFFIYV